MFLDHPLQQHASHRTEPFQLTFAHRAKSILHAPADCVLQESSNGLTMLARNEEALEAPAMILREVFGTGLMLSPPQVRLAGVPPQEPVMHIRVNVASEHIDVVARILQRRAVRLLEESSRSGRFIVRGEAPLRRVLGLSAELKRATHGTALTWTALTRYAPCEPEPEPTAA